MQKYFLFLIAIFITNHLSGQVIEPREKNGLIGFFEGDALLTDFQYDSVTQHITGAYLVRQDSKWGVVKDGKEVIPTRYDEIEIGYKTYFAKLNGKQGALDSAGMVILDFIYDDIDHLDGNSFALVKYQGKWAIYRNGEYSYDTEEFIFHSPQTMPLFPGCESQDVSYNDQRNCAQEKLYRYIGSTLKYPAAARERGIQGTVIVSFVVAPTGEVQNVKIVRGIGGGANEESIRMVENMPDWVPGVQDGQPVATVFTMPIKFVLQ